MTDNIQTPSELVSAESGPLPEPYAFERYLAGVIQVDDLLLVHGVMYRVKARTPCYTTPQIVFTVWPCDGGYAQRFECLPAQVVEAVTFDVEEQTRPMQAVEG